MAGNRMTVSEFLKQPAKKGYSKYGAKKTVYNDVKYDSKKEARYAETLDTLRNAKLSTDRVVAVERQIRYNVEINGCHICAYILDFKVTYADGRVEYVDVKGYRAGPAYTMFRLKAKLMVACHNITIKEV